MLTVMTSLRDGRHFVAVAEAEMWIVLQRVKKSGPERDLLEVGEPVP